MSGRGCVRGAISRRKPLLRPAWRKRSAGEACVARETPQARGGLLHGAVAGISMFDSLQRRMDRTGCCFRRTVCEGPVPETSLLGGEHPTDGPSVASLERSSRGQTRVPLQIALRVRRSHLCTLLRGGRQRGPRTPPWKPPPPPTVPRTLQRCGDAIASHVPSWPPRWSSACPSPPTMTPAHISNGDSHPIHSARAASVLVLVGAVSAAALGRERGVWREKRWSGRHRDVTATTTTTAHASSIHPPSSRGVHILHALVGDPPSLPPSLPPDAGSGERPSFVRLDTHGTNRCLTLSVPHGAEIRSHKHTQLRRKRNASPLKHCSLRDHRWGGGGGCTVHLCVEASVSQNESAEAGPDWTDVRCAGWAGKSRTTDRLSCVDKFCPYAVRICADIYVQYLGWAVLVLRCRWRAGGGRRRR